ncbi:protein brambleberry [Cephus cinctus]|uniref:Protein brambleberry n=1 Tax=Cephus cinctus TaxID=211228 RepID=A0AAJ7FDP7_CEPCN|nr:protein brambleberry [Cephus cinctus]XP_015586685.1 protein brambleberry [Cephus cinctus]XP_024936726.1 protein brambleberry [Cephus cinctus]
MQPLLLLVALIAFSICNVETTSLLDWVWGNKPLESTVLVADGIPLISIPYESMTDDEKFLQEAAKLTEIQVSSPLDTCQHKVVMKIKTSCSDITEEELAKLSVNLLNCQSAVEGRKMFSCTEEMSLKQCTTDMDPDMWNAYHLMSNRARAVCYAARNTQFRALTELTVNKLMHTAHSQIKALSSLKESQERLEEQTLEALSSLSDGNKALLQQQENLKNAQASAHQLVTTNLRELNNEKALIRSGHAQLAAMTEDIRNKLEKASQELIEQSVERGENHKEVIADLMNIQVQAHLIWDRIESSTNRIVAQNMEAAAQYEETLKKLEQINETIHFIWNITDTMRFEVDRKLGWITEYIGDTGEQLHRAYRSAMHIIYLLIAMVVAAFLQAPFLTRATIMGVVPLNLASFLKHGTDACLDFISISALIFLITAMHYVMVGIQYLFGPNRKTVPIDCSIPSIRLTNANGASNGYLYQHSPSPVPSVHVPLNIRILKKLYDIWNIVLYQISFYKNKIQTCIPSLPSWTRRSMTPYEEMSCSYVSSKKSREDLITNYAKEFPSMSDDATDYESSGLNEVNDKFDDLDDIVDANDLRRRMNRRNGSVSRTTANNRITSPRSNTPTFSSPKLLCSAITRTGRSCRLYAQSGQNFCFRHSNGSSFMGD